VAEDQIACPRVAATLYLTNHNWANVVVYVIHGSARDLLGRVPSIESGVFDIPAAMLGSANEIVLVVDPGAGESFVTPPIVIRPPHTVIDVTIENVIAYSTVYVTADQN
jgi:hypothetical protein